MLWVFCSSLENVLNDYVMELTQTIVMRCVFDRYDVSAYNLSSVYDTEWNLPWSYSTKKLLTHYKPVVCQLRSSEATC